MALSEREVRKLSQMLPPTSSIMATAIAKLLLTSPNPRVNRNDSSSIYASFPHLNSNDWSDTGVFGGLVLVVDRATEAVLLQIYDLDAMLKRFEFEIYYDMEYQSLDPSFHSFEMEECVAGLSFSSREIARKFLAKVRAMTPESSSRIMGSSVSGTPGASEQKKKAGFFSSAPPKQKPLQISGVTNVVHHQHVGVQGDGNLDLDTVSPEWRTLLKQAGVRKKDLKNPEVSRALIQSIQQSGYSLAVAPGTYVQASPLKPKEGPLAERKPPASSYNKYGQQPGMPQQPYGGGGGGGNYAGNRQTKVYTPQELQKHYTKAQVDMYVSYQKQLEDYEKAQKKYLEDLAEYEKQVALMKWEKDNQAFLKEQEKLKRVSKDPKYTVPPPLPPRKTKTPGNSEMRPGNSEMRPGNSEMRPGYSDVRPRFETAPAGQHQHGKSYASVQSNVTTQSMPNPPMRHKYERQGPLSPQPQMSQTKNYNDGYEDMMGVPPPRPRSPQAPTAPQLPTLNNGDNPVINLQEQLQMQAGRLKPADRPVSKMLLRAVAGSQLDLREMTNSVKRTDPSKTQDILGTLISALAVRRAQLGEDNDDSDDDWSD